MIDDLSPYYRDPNRIVEIRRELAMLGIDELTSPEGVTAAVEGTGSLLLLVNCDDECAATKARPAIALASQHETLPDRICFVFAGQELEAVARARSYLRGHFPTSPQIALLKGGEVVYTCDRDDIEKRLRTPEKIAGEITAAFDEHCGPPRS